MLKQPTPGLRKLHNKTKQPAKVEIVVDPYDELEVSAEVAAQLEASGQFGDGSAPSWPDEWNPPAEEESEKPAPAKAAPAKKAAKRARKATKKK